MQLTDRHMPAGQDVVAEEIDGEVVIVNLQNGNYYSLTQSATLVWAGLQQHASVGQIRDRLALRYRGDVTVMNKDLEDLVRALEAEQLIRRLPGSEDSPQHAEFEPNEPSSGEQEEYLPPMFERFTDMGDLLLLDPVHEAEDEKGWPHAKTNA